MYSPILSFFFPEISNTLQSPTNLSEKSGKYAGQVNVNIRWCRPAGRVKCYTKVVTEVANEIY